MEPDISEELAKLRAMTVGELRERYAVEFNEAARSWNKAHLFKRIAYRVQERALGTLSERARARAAELVDETTVRSPTRTVCPSEGRVPMPPSRPRDPRLPAPGTVIVRQHGGREHHVLVTEEDFEYEDVRYRSLSAVARKITGAAWNGLLFFGLTKRTKRGG